MPEILIRIVASSFTHLGKFADPLEYVRHKMGHTRQKKMKPSAPQIPPLKSPYKVYWERAEAAARTNNKLCSGVVPGDRVLGKIGARVQFCTSAAPFRPHPVEEVFLVGPFALDGDATRRHRQQVHEDGNDLVDMRGRADKKFRPLSQTDMNSATPIPPSSCAKRAIAIFA